nr:putative mitochondrial protein [Ipomoea batatas]GME10473.1 putative mitochondrial protein [Ipomoea batatas]
MLWTLEDGEEKPTVDEYVEEEPDISFNAIVGLTRGNMMKVLVQLAGLPITALLDSGRVRTLIFFQRWGCVFYKLFCVTLSGISNAIVFSRGGSTTILSSSEDTFANVTTLPHSQDCDHRIVLMSGSDPVVVRPYRYPQLLKNEIERKCIEMLRCGIIRTSRSPFASPCLTLRSPPATTDVRHRCTVRQPTRDHRRNFRYLPSAAYPRLESSPTPKKHTALTIDQRTTTDMNP